jgi:hypothetical protein
MFPLVSQGHGGEMFVWFGAKGRKLEIYSPSLMTNTYYDQSAGKASAYIAGANLATININRYFFGGLNTYHPSAYANHKPLAFYKDRLYQHCITNMDNKTNEGSYLMQFDGSGLIYPGGTAYYDLHPERGQGTTLLFPSGTSNSYGTNICWADSCLINHNGSLWMLGSVIKTPATSDWTHTKLGWERRHTGTSAIQWGHYRRGFSWAQININAAGEETRIMGPVTVLGANSENRVAQHACDAIGYRNDLYLATYLDVIRYPSCSGTPQSVEAPSGQETSKCFTIYPSEGISNSVAQGADWLLMLNGSGVIKKVNDTNTQVMTDLSNVNSDVRITNNWSARLDSTVDEPCRSTCMFRHNDKLHAFVTSATSGYHWFKCTGAISGTTNWTDHTESLPYPVKSFDGNLFSTVNDDITYAVFYTMGNVGLWGHDGTTQGAGATYLYQIKNETWTELYSGQAGMGGRGVLPYQNYGPHAFIPSGSNPQYYKASDYTILTYQLYDELARNVNVSIQYSTDNINWSEARQFRSYDGTGVVGSGKANLPTSRAGIEYDFYWDHVNDVGFSTAAQVRLRIKPTLVR